MNQDSSFPPMLPPSSELGALLFAVLPCLQDTYRPLASFAYHMTELTRIKSIPSVPSFSGLSGIDALITDKDIMLRSLSFYGRMFRMPLLSTIASLLQGIQFYQAYKDILPGLVSGFSSAGGTNGSGGISPDIFSILGGLSPDLMSSLFSGFAGKDTGKDTSTKATSGFSSDSVDHTTQATDTIDNTVQQADNATFSGATSSAEPDTGNHIDSEIPTPPETTGFSEQNQPHSDNTSSDTLFDSLHAFLTPEQQKIYEQLMHTD